MSGRFTVHGGADLEFRLAELCEQVRKRIEEVVPARRIEALVLGGGYGRGEGGVLQSEDGELPYNDLEFHLFLSGSRVWNEMRYGARLQAALDSLTSEAGLHIEARIGEVRRLGRPVTMFDYDLVMGHRIISGGPDIFAEAGRLRTAAALPMREATRLLMNRCSGLLFATEKLRGGNGDGNDYGDAGDFARRNLEKAKLALGDALLAGMGSYHWSCRERHLRVQAICVKELDDLLPLIRELHRSGVEFKLRPFRSIERAETLLAEIGEITSVAWRVWRWMEEQRLAEEFVSPRHYATTTRKLWPETRIWVNALQNFRMFGAGAWRCSMAFQPLRERLLRSLALLLFDSDAVQERDVNRFLQRQLQTRSACRTDLISAYERIWRRAG